MAVSIDDLREVHLLRGLKEADLVTLAADLAERRVAAGDPIVGEGTGGVAFFFILEGETSVSVAGDEVATLKRGDYVGELLEASEVFLASSIREVQGVAELDGVRFECPGPTTSRIAGLLSERIQAELSDNSR